MPGTFSTWDGQGRQTAEKRSTGRFCPHGPRTWPPGTPGHKVHRLKSSSHETDSDYRMCPRGGRMQPSFTRPRCGVARASQRPAGAGRRFGLVGPGLLRQPRGRHAAHRCVLQTIDEVHRCLRRGACLLTDACFDHDRLVPGAVADHQPPARSETLLAGRSETPSGRVSGPVASGARHACRIA